MSVRDEFMNGSEDGFLFAILIAFTQDVNLCTLDINHMESFNIQP